MASPIKIPESGKMKPLTKSEKNNAFTFIFYSMSIMVITGIISYYIQN